MVNQQRRQPVGADLTGDGCSFRVWAPDSRRVSVIVDGRDHPMVPLEDGMFEADVPGVRAGARYGYRLDGAERILPDIASRSQPDGPHGLSEVVDPASFPWTDGSWRGPDLDRMVIQEIHIGTFTPEGTWAAAAEKLPLLREAGIDAIELMPVNGFFGGFGWGYDGVQWFAPAGIYGRPDDLKAFIDRAHALGMAVILDVVYNHLGPEGEYFHAFSKKYFSTRYENEWGEPLNFDDDGAEGMRRMVIANAAYWIGEFHFDGLRFDATQQIFDATKPHVVAEAAAAARAAAGDRRIFLVAENTPQDPAMVAPAEAGGLALDALWNEDFQRAARIVVTGQRDAYYSDLAGTAFELVNALRRGFLYQGQRSGWEKQPRGGPTAGLDPACFVSFIENHDQCANSLRGDRLAKMGDPSMLRAVTALMMLGPQTPMLFQGQEWGSTRPFTYFADFTGDLAKAVRNGRQSFLEQFPCVKANQILDPCDERTFRGCVLDWTERDRNVHWLAFHRDLARLRRGDPVIARRGRDGMDGSTPFPTIGALRLAAPDGDDRLLIVNTGIDLKVPTIPDPLFSAGPGVGWRILFTTDAHEYGGRGTVPPWTEEGWNIPGRSTVLLAPDRGGN
jgi:maltooligosyltrehalose trehalohydrolase